MFSTDGLILATGSKDKSIGIIDQNGQLKSHLKDASQDSISTLCFLNNDILASGDDDGYIKVWDLRSNKSVFSAKE